MSVVNRPSLSIVVPMYREEDSVTPLLERVHEAMESYGGDWEIICVDDGSPDKTTAALKAGRQRYGQHVNIIELQRNFGQTAAMQAGIDAAQGELIVTMDGDLQNDPNDIPRMVDELQDRDLDLLQGWRQNRQDAAISRKLPSKIANRLIAKITGVELHDYGCSLKVYRAQVLKQVRLFGEMHRFIPIWVAGVTGPHRIGETPVHHHARQFGESKYGISRTVRVVIDLISAFFFLKYRARPGHFFGSIGLFTGAVGGMMLAWLLGVKFLLGEDIGQRPMLMMAILLLLAALQLITTGVIAEMLSRIFFQASEGRNFSIRHQTTDSLNTHWKRHTQSVDTSQVNTLAEQV
ncbi:glycosyltransferase family 2 protein [Spongiibacter sp. KMU-158]|uniref:Glycosyltransferase family 2 protein n=1 Tax=Spongiibacter pelagi TaxID=2760804 RepID=A0A927GVD1_9GAMM|nr:glycosyltransferase family 2 protein [Spongiibacter pelagi]MBD2858541.1 glycosyltransferase family 2 protein [Spongiibacter pelagi]